METDTGNFLVDKKINQIHDGQGTGPSTGSSCFMNDHDEEPIDTANEPVEDHMFALSIFLSHIIFLTRPAVLMRLVRKNKREVTIIIGIAISQNLM